MMDYSSMSDAGINKLVANSLSVKPRKTICFISYQESEDIFPDYCNNPADAWPIILENGISIFTDMIPHGLLGQARVSVIDDGRIASECLIAKDKNPLRAAMLVFLMMKDEAVNTQGEKV